MKAILVRHEKFIVDRRYLIEIAVHQILRSNRFIHGLKWGLVCLDQKSGKRIIMDNHYPKGPHIHIDEKEFIYEYTNLDQLISDFRKLVLKHMGVQI